MNKFMDKLTDLSGVLAKNSVLQVISYAFMMLLPFSMLGGFAGLFNGISYGPYQQFLVSIGAKSLLSIIYQWTTGMIGLYLAFLVAYSFATKNDLNDAKIAIGLTSVVCFLIVTPFVFPEDPFGASSLPLSWLGSSGMFTAIIISFMVGYIFKFCKKYHIGIKLPDQVPPYIANQFTALIPVVLSAVLFAIVNVIFVNTSFETFHQIVYTIISAPLKNLTSNVIGLWILSMILYALWFFGIHGGMTVGPIMMVLFMQLGLDNLTAFQSGAALPHFFAGDALTYGTGSLPLLLAILLVAKSKSNRSIAKLAALPAFFGVDEPAYFGVPMIYNALFFLPWVIIGPTISIFGTHLLKLVHLLGYSNASAAQAQNLPFFVSNMMNYGISGLIWGLVLFAIMIVVYIPFVKAFDKQKLEEENIQ